MIVEKDLTRPDGCSYYGLNTLTDTVDVNGAATAMNDVLHWDSGQNLWVPKPITFPVLATPTNLICQDYLSTTSAKCILNNVSYIRNCEVNCISASHYSNSIENFTKANGYYCKNNIYCQNICSTATYCDICTVNTTGCTNISTTYTNNCQIIINNTVNNLGYCLDAIRENNTYTSSSFSGVPILICETLSANAGTGNVHSYSKNSNCAYESTYIQKENGYSISVLDKINSNGSYIDILQTGNTSLINIKSSTICLDGIVDVYCINASLSTVQGLSTVGSLCSTGDIMQAPSNFIYADCIRKSDGSFHNQIVAGLTTHCTATYEDFTFGDPISSTKVKFTTKDGGDLCYQLGEYMKNCGGITYITPFSHLCMSSAYEYNVLNGINCIHGNQSGFSTITTGYLQSVTTDLHDIKSSKGMNLHNVNSLDTDYVYIASTSTSLANTGCSSIFVKNQSVFISSPSIILGSSVAGSSICIATTNSLPATSGVIYDNCGILMTKIPTSSLKTPINGEVMTWDTSLGWTSAAPSGGTPTSINTTGSNAFSCTNTCTNLSKSYHYTCSSGYCSSYISTRSSSWRDYAVSCNERFATSSGTNGATAKINDFASAASGNAIMSSYAYAGAISTHSSVACSTGASGTSVLNINSHSAGDACIDIYALGGAGKKSQITIRHLPTTDPLFADQLWNNAGILSISAG